MILYNLWISYNYSIKITGIFTDFSEIIHGKRKKILARNGKCRFLYLFPGAFSRTACCSAASKSENICFELKPCLSRRWANIVLYDSYFFLLSGRTQMEIYMKIKQNIDGSKITGELLSCESTTPKQNRKLVVTNSSKENWCACHLQNKVS